MSVYPFKSPDFLTSKNYSYIGSPLASPCRLVAMNKPVFLKLKFNVRVGFSKRLWRIYRLLLFVS